MNNYLIAIKRNHGDYWPILWELTPLKDVVQDKKNRGKNPNIEEIDRYTVIYEEETLKTELLRLGAIYEEDMDKPLVIIFDDGKRRELTNGILYENEQEAILPETISDFILENVQNTEVLNKIYNKFANNEENSQFLEDILFAINRIEYVSKIRHNFKITLDEIKDLPYLERRNFGLYINRVLKSKENNQEVENSLTLKKPSE